MAGQQIFQKAHSSGIQNVHCNYSYYWKRAYFLVFVQGKYCEALIQVTPRPREEIISDSRIIPHSDLCSHSIESYFQNSPMASSYAWSLCVVDLLLIVYLLWLWANRLPATQAFLMMAILAPSFLLFSPVVTFFTFLFFSIDYNTVQQW